MKKAYIAGIFIVFIAINVIAKSPEWNDIRLDCGTTIGVVHVLIPVGDDKRVRLTFTCKADA